MNTNNKNYFLVAGHLQPKDWKIFLFSGPGCVPPPIPSILHPIWWEIENKSQMQQVGNIFWTYQSILAAGPGGTVPPYNF